MRALIRSRGTTFVKKYNLFLYQEALDLNVMFVARDFYACICNKSQYGSFHLNVAVNFMH